MDNPKSIHDLRYYDSYEATQEWLDMTPFVGEGQLHLPSHKLVQEIRDRFQQLSERMELHQRDILVAYQLLRSSPVLGDSICGFMVSGHKCGGIMDEEVSAFGVYY